MLALASGQRSGLKVDPVCISRADKWLRSISAGEHGGLFCRYEPGRPVTSTMTAIGLLCPDCKACRAIIRAGRGARLY